MGLFSRRPQPVAPPPEPVLAGDPEIARRVVRAHLLAVGNDPQLRYTALQLSQAGGGPADLQDMMKNQMRTGDTGIARPWHWLVEVARLCRLTGDTELLAEITLVVQFWDTQLRGRIGLGDAQDMMLSCPPPGVVVEVYSIALPALERIDPDHLVMRNATGDLTMRVLLMLAALYVLEHPDGSSPEARSAAARIVATRGAGT